jgi:hypothetical protein
MGTVGIVVLLVELVGQYVRNNRQCRSGG